MEMFFSCVSAFVPKLLILAGVPESYPALLKIHIPSPNFKPRLCSHLYRSVYILHQPHPCVQYRVRMECVKLNLVYIILILVRAAVVGQDRLIHVLS